MRVLIILAALAVVSIFADEIETVMTSNTPPKMRKSSRSIEVKSAEKPSLKSNENVPTENVATKSAEKPSIKQMEPVEKLTINETDKHALVTPNENSVTPEDTAGTPEEELEKEKAEQEKLAKEDGDVSAAQSDANKSSPKEISVEVQPDALDEPGPVNHLIDAHTEKQDSHPVEEAKQKSLEKLPAPAELKQELQNKNVTDVLEEKKITDPEATLIANSPENKKMIDPEATPIANSTENKKMIEPEATPIANSTESKKQ